MTTEDEHPAPMMYPAPLEEARGGAVAEDGSEADIETPILIVGGGPVGMLQALMLSRIHKQKCTLIEREENTTTYPKMEYTNGRAMEIYRQMGLHEEFRALATQYLPEDSSSDEMNVTSLNPGGYLIRNWQRPRATDHRKASKEQNDGSKYLEPHLRAHQILVESWLKNWLLRESNITGLWGHAFLGLSEGPNGVITEVKKSDGEKIKIKSDYVIGCDGGGSWVRKSVELESKRNYLDMALAFVHLKSKGLREMLPFGPFWHCNVIHGGIVVAQDEVDTFTIHMVIPPGVDINKMSAQEVVNMACAGTLDPVNIPLDKVFCRGVWKVEVAIANSFRSNGGRVFLAGDSAHQLSPVGGHGLNSGLADAYDLAWKLCAVMRGWGGDTLLDSYDIERRQVAHKNLVTVQECLENIVMPLIANPHLDRALINAKTTDGEKARHDLSEGFKAVSWFHDQNGNILGYQYIDSPIVVADEETGERPISKNFVYKPTTYPGSRLPHVWLSDDRTSTLDLLHGNAFNLIDFSEGGHLSKPFIESAKSAQVPLNVLVWDKKKETGARNVYESDLILVRPDAHVAWRSQGVSSQSLTPQIALGILERAAGREGA